MIEASCQKYIKYKLHRKTLSSYMFTVHHLYVYLAVNKTIIGTDNMELVHFDVQREPVSIHQPLPRLLAGGH